MLLRDSGLFMGVMMLFFGIAVATFWLAIFTKPKSTSQPDVEAANYRRKIFWIIFGISLPISIVMAYAMWKDGEDVRLAADEMKKAKAAAAF